MGEMERIRSHKLNRLGSEARGRHENPSFGLNVYFFQAQLIERNHTVDAAVTHATYAL